MPREKIYNIPELVIRVTIKYKYAPFFFFLRIKVHFFVIHKLKEVRIPK